MLPKVRSGLSAVQALLDEHVAFSPDPGLELPIRPATCFEMASVSKHFTAFAVLMLESAGKLRLNDPIQAYLPELEGRADLAVSEQGWRMAFDDDGTLPTDWSWVEGGWW